MEELVVVDVEDHMEELVVVDVFESCPCVFIYTFVCVEINTKRETVLLRMLENVRTMLVRKSRFFSILSWGRRE